jgi:hypothetical protein
MMHTTKAVGALAAAAALIATLAGCSALLPEVYGPERGSDGQVLEASDAAATFLVVGDCFGFTTDGDLSRVTIVPCSQDHDWQVIEQGDLTLREEREIGTQNAVSAKCAEPFTAFEAAAGDGTRPWQQFLLSEAERENRTVTVFTCVATATVPEP